MLDDLDRQDQSEEGPFISEEEQFFAGTANDLITGDHIDVGDIDDSIVVIGERARINVNYYLTSTRKARTEPPFILPQQQTTELVGRFDEIQTLEALLLHGQARKVAGIVGLAGAGGIGKSALACHFAEKYRDQFPDGVIGIRVDNKDVDNIAREFARLDGEVLDEEDTRRAAAIMQDLFASKRMLLILDNAESADIRDLHPGGTSCAIIVTTRDRALPAQIDIPGEQLIDLPELPDEEAKALLAQFVDGQKLEQEAQAVARILALTGNLPLALEIVGRTLQNRLGRFPDFSIEEYADRLNLDRLKLKQDSHFNVRLCFNRSIEYLEEDDRRDLVEVFARLCVCASSGFALHTATAVIREADAFPAREALSELVDLSLLNSVQSESPRFIFHPLLQEFARELAKEQDLLQEAQEAHALYFIKRVSEVDFEELEADLDDIISAAEWMAGSDNEAYVAFYLKLRILFNRLGHWRRARQIIEVFLALAEERKNWFAVAQFQIQQAKFDLLQGDFSQSEQTLVALEGVVGQIEAAADRLRTEAMRLNTLGGLYQRLGKFEEAEASFRQSAEIESRINNRRGQAKVLNSLGGVYQRQGKFEEAVAAFRQSAEIERAINNRRGQAMVLNSLGGVYQRQGKFEEAEAAFRQSYDLLLTLRDDRGQAMVLNSLGGVYQRQGKFEEAVAAFQQSAEIENAINNRRGQAMVLNSLGGVYQRQGKFEEAQAAFRQSYDLLVKLGDDRGQAMVLNSLGGVYQRQGKFEEAQADFRQSYEIGRRLRDRRHLAMVATSWGRALLDNNLPAEAVPLLQEAFDIEERLRNRRGLGIVTPPLCRALQRTGRSEEALSCCERALKIAPKDTRLQKLHQSMQVGSDLIKQGRIKRVLHKDSGFRFGFIAPDDGSPDIYFGENQLVPDLRSQLTEGLAVTAEIDQLERGPRARRVWLTSPENKQGA